VLLYADPWLSAIMQREVLRVDLAPDRERADFVEELLTDLRGRKHAFYYAKVDCEDVRTARGLTLAGFDVVDVNVTFALGRSEDAQGCRDEIEIRQAAPDDGPAILEVAESCFRYSRFHLDPLVPAALAHRIKREWIANYLAKQRGDRLFVALLGGRPVGFLAALSSGAAHERTATIDLVGVDPGFQHRGVGQRLVEAFIRHYRGSQVLQVGTQVANVPSIRLYEKLGFSLTKSQYVLHMHVRGGRVVRSDVEP